MTKGMAVLRHFTPGHLPVRRRTACAARGPRYPELNLSVAIVIPTSEFAVIKVVGKDIQGSLYGTLVVLQAMSMSISYGD